MNTPSGPAHAEGCTSGHRVFALAGLAVLTLGLGGCGRSDAATGNAGGAAGSGMTPAATSTVRTAARPSDACGWLPATEVEAIVGSLAGPPRTVESGCLYPLPVDTLTARRREAARKLGELARQLEKQFGPPTDTLPDIPPPETAVIVDVAVGQAVSERGLAAGFNVIVRELDTRDARERSATDTASPPTPKRPPEGWDRLLPTFSVLHRELALGVGHLAVRIAIQTPVVSNEQALALANRVRSRIPDLPFRSEAPRGTRRTPGAGADRDPCSLLTAAEAETVLGQLVVPPYRAEEGSYLAHEEGKSCAYFTKGHRALVLTPTWEYGGMEVEAIRGVGGLIGQVAPSLLESPADTLDEEWEEVGADATTGDLYFLEGERLLKIGYVASSTDANGAVRLARLAMRRLAAGLDHRDRGWQVLVGLAAVSGSVAAQAPASADTVSLELHDALTGQRVAQTLVELRGTVPVVCRRAPFPSRRMPGAAPSIIEVVSWSPLSSPASATGSTLRRGGP